MVNTCYKLIGISLFDLLDDTAFLFTAASVYAGLPSTEQLPRYWRSNFSQFLFILSREFVDFRHSAPAINTAHRHDFEQNYPENFGKYRRIAE